MKIENNMLTEFFDEKVTCFIYWFLFLVFKLTRHKDSNPGHQLNGNRSPMVIL